MRFFTLFITLTVGSLIATEPLSSLPEEKIDLSLLPSPYNQTHLMPFNPGGWFLNACYLGGLLKQHKVKTVIEVGSWMGASTRFIAKELPEDGLVYAVDTWKGSPNENHPPEILESLYDQFLSNVIHTNLVNKIIPIKMDSLEAATRLQIYPDLIYLDATHTEEAVYQDLCAWFPFVKGHGILCGDDWAWGYYAVGKAVQKFAQENNLTVHVFGNWFWYLEEL